MRPMSDRVLIRETLAWCNKIRVACNLPTLAKMPKGQRNAVSQCPIAIALSNGLEARVDGVAISIMVPFARRNSPEYQNDPINFTEIAKRLRRLNLRDVDVDDYAIGIFAPEPKTVECGVAFITPPVMTEFINRFDEGKLVELIEGSRRRAA